MLWRFLFILANCPIPGKISVIRFSHSCRNYSIIRLPCPAFSSAQLFPIFMHRSNSKQFMYLLDESFLKQILVSTCCSQFLYSRNYPVHRRDKRMKGSCHPISAHPVFWRRNPGRIAGKIGKVWLQKGPGARLLLSSLVCNFCNHSCNRILL